MRSTQPVSIRRKWNAVLTVFFFITIFLPLAGSAQEVSAPLNIKIDQLKEYETLVDHYDAILDYQDSTRCTSYSALDPAICEVSQPTVLYLYATDLAAPEGVIAKNVRQLSSNTFQIFSSDAFYKNEQDNTWKQTEFGVIEKTEFNTLQENMLKSAAEVSSLNNPFKIYKVNAQSPIYPGVDGWCRYLSGSAGWTTIRNGNGDACNSSDEMYVGWNHAEDQIYRTRLTFDTSSLSNSVSSSTLIIKQLGKANSVGDIGLYGITPVNNSAMSNSDYENTDEVLKSDTYTNSSQSNDSAHVFLLNASGRGEIDVDGYSHFSIRARKDADNTEPTNGIQDYVTFYQSETSGTASDPYLLVETGEAEATTTPPTASTTLSEIPALPLIDDLTVITGRTDHYESSTTAPDWSELHYYRIPFILWWILTATFLFILGFILNQIQRILRKKK